MSDYLMPYADLPLRGEKVSSQSVGATTAASRDFIRTAVPVVSRAASTLWPVISVCGVVVLSAGPALLLFRYSSDQLFDALVHVSLEPTIGELLGLSLVLAYLVLTGLMLSRITGRPRRKAFRVLLGLAAAPLVTLLS